MSGQPIIVRERARVTGGFAAFFGLLTISAIGGIATAGDIASELIVLIIAVPPFLFYMRRAIQRSPVLVIESTRFVDVRGHNSVRWDSVAEAAIKESHGLFGAVYHRLSINSTGEPLPVESDRMGATPVAAEDAVRIAILSIDQLSLSWEEMAMLVEERLPSAVTLDWGSEREGRAHR